MQTAPHDGDRPAVRATLSPLDPVHGVGRALRAVYPSSETALPADLQRLLGRLH